MSMQDLVAEISRLASVSPALVSYTPDPALEAGFGRQPPLATRKADTLGFKHDGTLATLVASALTTLS